MLRVTVLSVSDLSLSFGDHAVLSDVSFSLNEGDRLGVIGVNGAGKTTLFRVITGDYKQDSGSVFISKDKTVGILRQDVAVMCEGSDVTLVSYILDAFPELLSLEKEISETENAFPNFFLSKKRFPRPKTPFLLPKPKKKRQVFSRVSTVSPKNTPRSADLNIADAPVQRFSEWASRKKTSPAPSPPSAAVSIRALRCQGFLRVNPTF